MTLSGSGRIAGIAGWPVAHSLSPLLHGYWLLEHDIDGAYVPLAIAPDDFVEVVQALAKAGFVGLNITVPHKEAAFSLAHETDEFARAAGAANLLSFRDGRIFACNTDVGGLTASVLEALGPETMRGATAAVLGAGGAARAAVLACDRLGACRIVLVCRQIERGNAVVDALKKVIGASLDVVPWDAWFSVSRDVRLLFNATSGGMKGSAPLVLDLAQLPPAAAVCDLVYNPLETALLKEARARGHRTVDGLGMLMYQAAPAFEAFFGVSPRVTRGLRALLEETLGRDC